MGRGVEVAKSEFDGVAVGFGVEVVHFFSVELNFFKYTTINANCVTLLIPFIQQLNCWMIAVEMPGIEPGSERLDPRKSTSVACRK